MKILTLLMFFVLGTGLSLSPMNGLAPVAFAADDTAADGGTLPDGKDRYLFSVTLHSKQEIRAMLTRAETLSKTKRTGDGNHAGIALVLHGPEIKLFTKSNYRKNRELVDTAARLDANGVIDIKICRTAMKTMDIKPDDLPAFVEIVPYGPEEEKRLRKQGYIYL